MNKAVGIDVGGTFIKSAIVQENGEILFFSEHETPNAKPEQFVNLLGYISELALKESGIDKMDISGVGIGFPGTVASESGIVSTAPNLPSWKEYNVKKAMEKWLKLPVIISNDANNAVLAEKCWGVAKDFNNIVGLTLGTGVGGGIIIDGKMFTGSRNSGAELGHIVIDINGPKCGCGKYGCLECFVSERGFIREATLQRKKDKGSLLWVENSGKLTPQSITNAAEKDDKAALVTLNNVARYLAVGIVSMCEILEPEIVVIGGGLSKTGDLLFMPLMKNLRRIRMITQLPIIRVSSLDNKAGVMGAAAMIFKTSSN